ncbi:MAG: DUF4433 domain-containing protein [Spirochaetia bacterium]|nr:DUF4433 domain-containing protein [Spirochaetia bacterium]
MKTLIKERGISSILHVTRMENLQSILTHGLMPRSMLDDKQIEAVFNDDVRHDVHLDHVSCSISFPNYKRFHSLRKKYPAAKWVILLLDPNVLVDKSCAFYFQNTATIMCRDMALENIRGREACELLFAENSDGWFRLADLEAYERRMDYIAQFLGDHRPSADSQPPDTRGPLGIPDRYTTDPQAEVLIKGLIEKEYIQSVVFNSADEVPSQLEHTTGVQFKVFPGFFGPRIDHLAWS